MARRPEVVSRIVGSTGEPLNTERLWASLLRLRARMRKQAAVLLLELVLDEAQGRSRRSRGLP